MNRNQFDKVERRPVTKDDFLAALEILVKPVTSRPKRENRDPTPEERNQRFRLDRKPR